MVRDHVEEILEQADKMSSQHGFRKGHSCQSNLLTFYEETPTGNMKPPVRRRSAPVRFEEVNCAPGRTPAMRLAWLCKEKLDLLRGLKTQTDEKILNPSVQGRSQAEISSYIDWLRGRVAREAVQTIYEKWVKDRKLEEAQTPAPIELWTDLVCRMSSPTEETVTTAFSQMLTIASTEPLTLRHSIPSKEPRKRASRSSDPAKKSLQQKGSSGEGPAPSGAETAAVESTEDHWKKLDFEKIYKYLSKATTGESLPPLSECESAVVLHLLQCIPAQLQTLDPQLGVLLRKTYEYMNSSPKSEDPEKEGMSSEPQVADWKDLGFCTLNPFLLPLELLQPKEETVVPS